MGIYYMAVCDEKQEYIRPHGFETGATFHGSVVDRMFAVAFAALLTDTVLKDDHDIDHWFGPQYRQAVVGRWAGCRARIVSDIEATGAYEKATQEYRDITPMVVFSMLEAPGGQDWRDDRARENGAREAKGWERRVVLAVSTGEPYAYDRIYTV